MLRKNILFKATKSLQEKSLKNISVTILLALLFLVLVSWCFIGHRSIIHCISYLSAMLLSALIVEAYAISKPVASEWEIKRPKKETGIILFVILMQAAVSTTRFLLYADWQLAPVAIRICTLIVMLLFIYPGFLSVYFFLVKRYKLSMLGLKVRNNIWLAVLIIVVIGSTTFFVAPSKLQFQQFLKENGFLQMVLLGFFSAAIPEEFVRLICQTRLGKLLQNKALAWFLASFLWALIHIPNFSQEGTLTTAFMEALGILPIGLLWGFMTERLKSIWPSVLVHGTNLWGLQNI